MVSSESNAESLSAPANRLVIAQRAIESARAYTLTLLEDLNDNDFFWTPPQLDTHIAWQVGHLAYAQYGLALFRIRGRLREDAELMSTRFRKQFAKGSTPVDRESTLELAEIKASFEAIYQQTIKEFSSINEDALDDPVDPPHAAFATKYGGLIFCAHHEMLHAGQIGLLRRLMGKEPVR